MLSALLKLALEPKKLRLIQFAKKLFLNGVLKRHQLLLVTVGGLALKLGDISSPLIGLKTTQMASRLQHIFYTTALKLFAQITNIWKQTTGLVTIIFILI